MKKSSCLFLVLDIETGKKDFTVKIGNKEENLPCVTWLCYGCIKLYDIRGNVHKSLQFRDWYELEFFMKDICRDYKKYELRCYVHNLAYECDYLMKNVSPLSEIISNSTHNVISVKLKGYENIRFCCSYLLSGFSLSKLGEIVGLKKLEDDYISYMPSDEIPESSLKYNERDCDIVAKYIIDVCVEEYGTISEIPYTKTGRVRKKYNSFYNEYIREEGKPAWDLMPDEDAYKIMEQAFAGGIVISDPVKTDIKLKNVVSYDITSSYPFACLSEEFPYDIKKKDYIEGDLTNKFWIAKIKFNNIQSKYTWQWLSISKMNDFSKNAEFFNGKLISADYIIRCITNVDFETIKLTYDYESFEIIEFYTSYNSGKLPKPYIQTIEEYANKKYKLKKEREKIKELYGENSKEYIDIDRLYMLCKNDFNSIYGMMVQKLVQPEFYVDENFIWHEKDLPYKKIENKHIKRNFLFGVYVTAYARYNIIKAAVVNCSKNLVYIDTDCLKYIDTDENFVDTNKVLYDYKDNPAIFSIGRFDFDGKYEYFKTLGAKKYAYVKDNIVYLTVAGLPKRKNINESYIQNIDDFSCGAVFEKCKLAKKYINNKTSIVCVDEEKIEIEENSDLYYKFIKENNIETSGGVALYETSYRLDMTDSDKLYIKNIDKLRREYIRKIYEKEI